MQAGRLVVIEFATTHNCTWRFMEMTDKKGGVRTGRGRAWARWRISERDRAPGRGATAPLLEKVSAITVSRPVVVPALAGKRHAVNFFGPFPEEP